MQTLLFKKALATAAIAMLASGAALASTFTSTSPGGVDVTAVGASTVGGIVVDLKGANGAHVVSQLAASTLFQGFYGVNPGPIGTQTGFTTAVTDALGGGLQSAAFRFSLYDGDSSAGDFDFNDNTLLVNGISFGNWSSVNAQNTDGLGNVLGGGLSGGGFRDNILDTGWFYSTSAADLSALFTSLVSSQSISFSVNDIDAGDNFYDFTQGIDQSLINVGQGPVVTPPGGVVPEPASLALVALGLAGIGGMRRRRA